MNLGKTNLFFAYLHILSAFIISILSYLHTNELKLDTKLYRYEVTGVTRESDGVQNFEVGSKQEFDIDTQTIQILIVTMFCIAGFFHLFYFSNGFYTKSYLSDIRSGYNRYRWLEYSITSSIMTFILCLLSGFKDLYTVILACVMVSSLSLIGFFIERDSIKSDRTIGLISGGGIIATILALFYVSYFNSKDEIQDQGGNVEDWVIGVLIGSGIILVAIGIITVLYVGGDGFVDFDYIMYEKFYTCLSYFAKAYLGYYTTYGILS